MGALSGATAVAGAVRASRGRHPLPRRVMAVVPMVRDTLAGRWPGAPRFRVLGGMAGIVYLLSPLDFLPEALLGPFGLGDDLALAAVSVAALLSAAEDYLDAREVAAGVRPGHGDVIPGVVLDGGTAGSGS